MAAVPQDLRYAFRTLRKAPLFSAVAVLSLAFGIGANTAIFTLIDQLILRRLPERSAATDHAGRPRAPLRRERGLATLLAALGLYGVMAFMVARRTREIGIRMALGADTGSVVWMVMREVLVLAAMDVAIGVGAAWAATRLIQAQLFGIQATDLATMAAAAP